MLTVNCRLSRIMAMILTESIVQSFICVSRTHIEALYVVQLASCRQLNLHRGFFQRFAPLKCVLMLHMLLMPCLC